MLETADTFVSSLMKTEITAGSNQLEFEFQAVGKGDVEVYFKILDGGTVHLETAYLIRHNLPLDVGRSINPPTTSCKGPFEGDFFTEEFDE